MGWLVITLHQKNKRNKWILFIIWHYNGKQVWTLLKGTLSLSRFSNAQTSTTFEEKKKTRKKNTEMSTQSKTLNIYLVFRLSKHLCICFIYISRNCCWTLMQFGSQSKLTLLYIHEQRLSNWVIQSQVTSQWMNLWTVQLLYSWLSSKYIFYILHKTFPHTGLSVFEVPKASFVICRLFSVNIIWLNTFCINFAYYFY